jgi:hypothetical protein
MNGSALLLGIDGRSPWERRCKDLITLHLGDLPDASVAEQSHAQDGKTAITASSYTAAQADALAREGVV